MLDQQTPIKLKKRINKNMDVNGFKYVLLAQASFQTAPGNQSFVDGNFEDF